MSTALQGDWGFLLPPDDLIPTVGDLETVAPFRQSWLYNNWGYGIAGRVIEKLSGQTFHDYIQSTVVQPLGLANTTTRPSLEANSSIAVPYAALENGTVYQFPIQFPFRDSLFEAAGGIFSIVNDLLKYVQAVLAAEKDPTSRPLRDLRILLSNQIPLDEISRDYRFYGMGWIRTQLPGVVGLQGDNAELFEWDELPLLGKGSPAKMVYYHQGASFGYYSAALMFPETESGIVVLTNSMALNDAADWIAQAYTNALFQFPQSADYVELAKESRQRKLANMAEVKTTFDKIRREHPGAARPLDTYTGKYYNSLGNFYIKVTKLQEASSEKLVIAFQGRETQVYDLRHLQGDTFEWALQHDESARRARFAIWDPEYFKIEFNVSDGNLSSNLSWARVTDILPQGLTLSRDVGSS